MKTRLPKQASVAENPNTVMKRFYRRLKKKSRRVSLTLKAISK
jgi:hypothetical protein